MCNVVRGGRGASVAGVWNEAITEGGRGWGEKDTRMKLAKTSPHQGVYRSNSKRLIDHYNGLKSCMGVSEYRSADPANRLMLLLP